jgi:hypothetical protein
MRLPARWLLGILLVAVTGCYTWAREPLPTGASPAYRQYQVWTRDSAVILQNIRVEHDTLYGIPADASRDCGICAVGIPMSRVDSLRSGSTKHGGTAVLGLGAVAVFFLLIDAALVGWND